MTVKIEKLRHLKPMTITELEKLHTGSLLSRLQSLRSLQESYEESDWLAEERDACKSAGLIAFKQTVARKAAYTDLKTVLATREHIPRRSQK